MEEKRKDKARSARARVASDDLALAARGGCGEKSRKDGQQEMQGRAHLQG